MLFQWRSCFRPPVWLYPIHLFSFAFFKPVFGQHYLRIKLYSNSYGFIIFNRFIFGLPLSLGCNKTIQMNYRWRGDKLIKDINVMVWCSFIILSLKFDSTSDCWVPSSLNRLWWCPRYIPEGDIVVCSFQFLNRSI